jgi:hypothetical protein
MEGHGMGNGTAVAILIGVWATFALDVFSTLNSSPQTTELFASERESSLMHWVAIGTGVGIGGGAIATGISGRVWPLAATVAVSLGMYAMYCHAVRRGTGQSGSSSSSAGAYQPGGMPSQQEAN